MTRQNDTATLGSALPDEEAAALLRPRYRVMGRVGSGASSIVYRVADRMNNGAILAAKLSRLTPSDDHPDPRADAAREFAMAARFRHPNLVPSYDLLMPPDRPMAITTMAYVNGRPFGPALHGIHLPTLLQLTAQLLRGLAFLHDNGLVHGDVKPPNVLVQQAANDATVRLLDYHLVYAVSESVTAARGTLRTMAPEIIAGGGGTIQSDLYSVGVILAEALIGRPLISGTARAVADAHLTGSLLGDASVPGALRPVLERLLAKRPRGRYASAADTITALAEASGEPLPVETQETLLGRTDSAPLVGRAGVMDHVAHHLKALNAEDGLGQFLVLSGPPGVGRTRLLREVEIAAQVEGARTVRLSGPWSRMRNALVHLARPVSESDTAPAAAANERFAVLDSAAAFLSDVAEVQPVVVLVDDADALDDAARDGVAFLARALARRAVMMCLTVKEATAVWENPTTEAWSLSSVTLEPLDHGESEALLGQMLPAAPRDLIERLADAWGGLPGLMAAGVRHLVQAGLLKIDTSGRVAAHDRLAQLLPETVEETMGTLYQAAPEGVKRCMEALAVADGPTPLADLAGVLGSPVEVLQRDLQAQRGRGWLSVDESTTGTRCALRQGAFGDLVRRRLPDDRRRTLHDRFAEVADRRARPVDSALHRLRGATPRDGVAALLRELMRPGSEALGRISRRDLQRALRHAARDERPALHEAVGDLAARQAALDDARSAYAEALDGLKATCADSVRLRRKMIQAYVRSGDYEEAIARGAELTRERSAFSGLGCEFARADLAVARAHLHLADTATAVELCVHVKDVARELSDEGLLAAGLDLEAHAYQQNDQMDWAERRFEQALDHYRRANDPTGAAGVLASLGYLDMVHCRWRQARRRLKQAATDFRSAGRLLEAAGAARDIGAVHHKLCEWDSARRYYRDALALYDEADVPREALIVLNNLSQIETATGDYEAALRTARRARRCGGGEPVSECAALLRQGRAHFGIGDMGAATACGQEAVEIARANALSKYVDSAHRLLGESAALQGRLDEGRDHLTKALDVTRENTLRQMEALCLLRLGEVDLARGDLPAAMLFVRAAVTKAEEIGYEPLSAQARLVRGKVLLARERPHDALADLQCAEPFFSTRGGCDDFMESSLELGLAYAAVGKRRFASLCYRKALDAADEVVRRMHSEEHKAIFYADPRRKKLFAAVRALADHRIAHEQHGTAL